MEKLITYGWIGSSIVAPTITAICVVVLFLFNVYKNVWRNVDYFLVCLTVQEIVSAILCFALSILNLLHNRNEQLCGLITGLWFAIRMLQLVTLTSLAIDRALILKWPYQYRFSVRSLQIKSHLVFVSLCCSSIALFAYTTRLDQASIQMVINELPATPTSITSNLAYFDLFSNPLFGGTEQSVDVTTPLSLEHSNKSLVRNSRSSDKFVKDVQSSPLVQSYSTSHLSSSLPPLFTANESTLPLSTMSMNYGGANSALLKQFSVCSLHPLCWQRTFNIILLALFAVLSVVTMICFIYVDCTRRCNEKRTKLITQTYSSSNYLNKHKLMGVSIMDAGQSAGHESFANSRYLSNHELMNNKTTHQLAKNVNQLNDSSPGNTNTTTTTCASDNAHQSSNHKSLNAAASSSTIALGDDQATNDEKYDQTAGESMSALCSMVDHDLARSTDALASTTKELCKGDKRSKMYLLSKSQPSLLHQAHLGKHSLDKKGSNLSVYSFDLVDSSRHRDAFSNQLSNQLKYSNNLKHSNQIKYSNQLQFKTRLPVRSSSMYTTQHHHHQLDNDHEPFSMQSREDLFSRKYLRDHYKICDLRWSSVVTCTSLCYAVNHAPTMILLVISLLMPQYWTLLNENILVWFSLIQGLLLPFCLYVADAPFRDTVIFAFKRNKSTDFSGLFNSKQSTNACQPQITLPGYSFAPSSYLTALSDEFSRTEDASLLRIYHNNLAASQTSLAQQMDSKSSINSKLSSNCQPNVGLHNNSPKYGFINQSPFNGRLPVHKKFVSSNSVNIYHNDFLLLDKPFINGPNSGAIHGAPDPRRSSFSCFLSSSGFPGYSTIAAKNQYYSSNKLNSDLPTIKCYQQLFANSVKFEQQLNTLTQPHHLVNCSNAKFPIISNKQNHLTKTNPVYLTNEHFLPNSRKSVATSEIDKLDQRKSLCEAHHDKNRPNNQTNKSMNRLYDSQENSLECPLLDQLNSLAASEADQVTKNANSGKQFKCSRLANIGLLSNVASLSGVRVSTHQSKMSRLLGNRKLDLKQAASKQKQRRSFSGEINCELLNSLDSVDRNEWPQLVEEVEASKSDTERDGCVWKWNSLKNQRDQKHLYGCVYEEKKFANNEQIDDLSLKRPALIVDDQLNLVDIENAIRNSTNLLNLSVFNVATDDEDSEISNELLRCREQNLKNRKSDDSIADDFELANDDFEYHTTTSICSTEVSNKSVESTKINQTNHLINLKESNSFKAIKKHDSSKVNGLFKKNSKLETNKINWNRIELDQRRKSITSITPLCTRPLLNSKQSKSVSDLTAQFENCIQNQTPVRQSQQNDLNGKRSTSESNLVIDSKDLLPASTALMLKFIKQSNNANNEFRISNLQITGSETITKKKLEPIRKTSSASSSDYSINNDSTRRQSRYLKREQQNFNKKEMSKQSMLPVPQNTAAISTNKPDSKSRLQQPPPHFRLLSASGLSNGYNLSKFNNCQSVAATRNKSNHEIRSTQLNNVPLPPKQLFNQISSSHYPQSANRPYQSIQCNQNLTPYKHHLPTNRQARQIELRRSNSSTSLALDMNCLLSNVNLKQSMPNLDNLATNLGPPSKRVQQSNLFPFNFQ